MNSSPSPSPLSGYVREFDGFRGLAILAVMVHHFWPRSGPLAAHSAIPHLGWVGVDLFFVLSGCLITGILLDTRGSAGYFKNFYARRVLRIFPLYFLFVAAAYILIPRLQAATNPGEFVQESGPAWWYLLYLGNLREALTGSAPAYVLAPTWSLCIEEQFYVAFPLLVAALPVYRLRLLLWVLVCFAPAFRLATAIWWVENERIQYLFTLSRVDTLALGGLLALAFRGYAAVPGKRATGILLPIVSLVFVGVFVTGGLDRTTWFGRVAGYTVVGFTMWVLVAWAIHRRGTAPTSWLRWTPLTGLGTICYGIYLLQRPAEVVLGKLAVRYAPGCFDPDTVTGFLAKCAVAVIAGGASWFLIECPILRLKSLFVSPRHPALTPPDC
ncbi:acyltransferase [Gemmata sp. G18]|uniref:Acyltransferase n=1 Tax=Gemmata palustris TaxID=2822762 RepID=A0ABS5C5V5_9BACT|nr:acyltransferase [Gemmata palustris]MBP3960478.1 acyltransferase [Gemmata palustris]